MSSNTTLYAQVYVYHADSRTYELVGENIDRLKLMAFSVKANRRLSEGSDINTQLPLNGRHSVIFEARTVDVPTAKAICKWIAENDLENPGPLTRRHAVTESFQDLVKLYYTSWRFFVPRSLRGNNIHLDIIWYIKAAPLLFDEFVMVMEYCAFDQSMCNAMMNDIMFRRVKATYGDPRLRCPEEASIEHWARAAGLWSHMEAIERKISEGFRHPMLRRALPETTIETNGGNTDGTEGMAADGITTGAMGRYGDSIEEPL